jgi:hypothetical protein
MVADVSNLRILMFAGVLAAVACLSGCASSGVAPASTASPSSGVSISATQKKALADNKVTYDEYEAGWRRYVACEADAGYTVKKLTEVNQVIQGTIPDAAVKSGVDAKCYEREFKQLDQIWQVSRENTSPQAQQLHECLIKHGQTPEATLAKMVDQLRKLGIDPASCLTS